MIVTGSFVMQSSVKQLMNSMKILDHYIAIFLMFGVRTHLSGQAFGHTFNKQ